MNYKTNLIILNIQYTRNNVSYNNTINYTIHASGSKTTNKSKNKIALIKRKRNLIRSVLRSAELSLVTS